MRVALVVPCYVDVFCLQVGIADLAKVNLFGSANIRLLTVASETVVFITSSSSFTE
jgi:hypothetical protein